MTAHLDDTVKSTAGLVKNGDDILAARLRFGRDATLDQISMLIGRNLTAHENVGARNNSLRLYIE